MTAKRFLWQAAMSKRQTPDNAVDIRQIRYFTEVALSRSFKGAAARLNISQSSLSRRVADLERSLDTLLLVRHPHGVSLTGGGQLFLERASAILRELDAIESEVSGRAISAAGVVTVGTSPTVSRVLLAPLAAAFERPAKSIRLRFVEGTQSVLLEGLDAGRIDVALMTTPEPVANCLMEVLLEEPLFLVSRKRERPRRKAIPISELEAMPLVMFPRPSTNRDLIERKARDHGVTLQCRYEVSNSVVQIEFVRLGLANSILPYFAVADHVTRSSLAATRIKDLSLSQTLVWRSDRPQNALVAEVAEAIRTIMRRRRLPHSGKGRRARH
jgi:LysR family transcriptional regulator, nitrogen assimilation regulatory protein